MDKVWFNFIEAEDFKYPTPNRDGGIQDKAQFKVQNSKY